VTFPVYLHFGPYRIHPHIFFETLSYVIAVCVYLFLRRRFGDPISTPIRWAAVAAAVAGAALGSKILYLFEDPQLTWRNLNNPAYLMGGKTIVGALAFGLLTVELVKRYIGLRTSTGDLYAIPLALGIAIGRIGCFLTGLADNTYGNPTHLPWAIDFGDRTLRHPTQLYEILFLLLLIPLLYVALKKAVVLSQPPDARRLTPRFRPGDAFKLFMVAYMSFRLLIDFLKPYPRIFLGLGGIQWACLLILLYYSPDILRWVRRESSTRQQS
jgi:prolipoprotein diacylglyceryltransferase